MNSIRKVSLRAILAGIFSLIWVVGGFAQNPFVLISSGDSVSQCGWDMFDSGGEAGSYSNNEYFTQTWYSSSGAPNTHITASITMFNVAAGDTLFIYDGESTAAPLLAAINNTIFTAPGKFRASVYNPTGCLTFVFKSDTSIVGAGWSMNVACGQACQRIVAAIDSATTPRPGNGNFVDICPHDTITFVADTSQAVFPDNDYFYHQDASSTIWTWDFGDGSPNQSGHTVSHVYSQSRGYTVNLSAADTNGCIGLEIPEVRVRTSGNPIQSVFFLPNVCVRDTIDIGAAFEVEDFSGSSAQFPGPNGLQMFDSTMFIPDGPYCDTSCYFTEVTFDLFLPGQTISSGTDITEICINMEHSFAGDMEITIYCPNGQSVLLKEDVPNGQAYMGVPYGGANHGDFDFGCDPDSNLAGTGWNYCWSEVNPNIGFMNPYAISFTQLDSTNVAAHTGNYAPEGPFSGLTGCPLNGTWSIEICDYWHSDNGYIFEWWLALDPVLMPNFWTYEVPVDTTIWCGPYILNSTDSSALVVPGNTGTYYYIMAVVDSFGCMYEAETYIVTMPKPYVYCMESISCVDGTDTLKAGGNYASCIWSPALGLDTTVGPVVVASPPSTTFYSVTATGLNGCKGSDGVEVRFPISVDLVVQPDSAGICLENDIELVASGAASYIWSGAGLSAYSGSTVVADPFVTTTYTVVGESNYGCGDSATVVVVVFPSPPAPELLVGDSTLTTSLAESYIWYFNNIPVPGSNQQSIIVDQTGNYFVQIFDEHGCYSFSDTISWIQTSNSWDMGNGSVRIFPNPSSGNLTIELEGIDEPVLIRIIDLTGDEVKQNTFRPISGLTRQNWNLSDLPAGMYFFRLETGSGSAQLKFVIQQ
ncbi:MAG: T9SS type A sorting domain-containing protein [Bacteroidetes bacterium]|nr:T9SS type A sorting domain-containing protein [Bacteroidota bacterium]MBU1720019.1 T9SS type A sorting domain-containing protein [Bacteroidota bacterium]